MLSTQAGDLHVAIVGRGASPYSAKQVKIWLYAAPRTVPSCTLRWTDIALEHWEIRALRVAVPDDVFLFADVEARP